MCASHCSVVDFWPFSSRGRNAMRCSSGIAPVRCAQIPELTIHDVLIPEMMKRHEVCRTGGGERRTPCFFVSSRRRHTRCYRDWSSDVCSSDLKRDLYPSQLSGGQQQLVAVARA